MICVVLAYDILIFHKDVQDHHNSWVYHTEKLRLHSLHCHSICTVCQQPIRSSIWDGHQIPHIDWQVISMVMCIWTSLYSLFSTISILSSPHALQLVSCWLFSVLVAEIIQSKFPTLVELHNYSQASATDKKMLNWAVLNR